MSDEAQLSDPPSSAASAVLSAIGAYKRYVSPHKGFGCACRIHAGRASCSTLAARAVRRYGAWHGLGVARARLRRCGEVHRAFHPEPPVRRRLRSQRGDCDPGCAGCDGCDLPSGSGGSGRRGGCLDFVDCSNACDCDCSRRDRDAAARDGPTVLWFLVALVAIAAGVIAFMACTTPACAYGWNGSALLTALVGVTVLGLRLNRDLPVLRTVAALAALAGLAVAMNASFLEPRTSSVPSALEPSQPTNPAPPRAAVVVR